jgi:fatty-acyl-CoA synthase
VASPQTVSAAAPPAAALDWAEVTTVGDLLVRGAARWPDSDAIVFPGERHTYASLLAAAERSSASLLGLGIRPGERVGLVMPSCLDFAETVFGCALAGISAVLINSRFKSYELGYVIRDSGLVALVTTDLVSEHTDYVPLLREATADAPPALRHLILLGASSPEGFVDRAAFEAAGEGVTRDDTEAARRGVRLRQEAMLMYTSGTTANPKGCVLSHEGLVRTGMGAAERWQITSEDKIWDPLPMFHMGAVFPQLAMLHEGATFITQTHFDPAEALRLMEEEGCTFAYPTFPTITQNLIHHPDFATTDLSRVRLVVDTGSAESLSKTQEHFPNAPVITLYGGTEHGGGVAFSHLDEPLEQRVTTGGRPFRGTRVRIVDPETRAELPARERGEIAVHGAGLFDGYHNDPVRTAEVLEGGWYYTGDLGMVDEDGRVTFLGRLKDMLKVGGENVAAAEIEAYLGTHPAVKIAQVVGVPDARYVEVPAAFVELHPGASADEDEIVSFCRGKIATFKVPHYVRFVDEWPMSATKIQKFRLRDELVAQLGLEPS